MAQPTNSSDTPEFQAALVDVLPHLRAFARSLTRRREQADDLVNDAVVRALSAADQFQPGTNFKAWMFTILRNLYYNEGRKNRSVISLDDAETIVPSVSPSQQAALEFCDFRRAFWQLGDDHREVLILVGASGLSYEEAAEVCDCAIGTIKSRVSRARGELVRLLSGDGLRMTRTESAAISGLDAKTFLDSQVLPKPSESTAEGGI
jgi:RNA polymerase sigma-70 factor (ECF subfamily)